MHRARVRAGVGAEGGERVVGDREGQRGLTRWPLGIAAGLTLLALVLAVPAVLMSNTPLGGLAFGGSIFAGCAAAIAWVLVYAGWVLALEIDPEKIRYGALSNADARARRGLPPSTTPYATWLHEYRCPVAAVRRVWIVRGARDALNTERSTGVPISLGSPGSRSARAGWIRTPFSPGGLMLQLDSPPSSPADQKMMWAVFARAPVSSIFKTIGILYTPISDPNRRPTALVSA